MQETEETVAILESQPSTLSSEVLPLPEFIADFGSDLMAAVRRRNPPVYDGRANPKREQVLASLSRQAFPAQREVTQSLARLLINHGEAGAIANGEMGTGKTMIGIALAAILHHEGFPRTLVLSPPHLVYKWRREIMATVPTARVWILNGPDTLKKLLQLRAMRSSPAVPEFFILGRVRMRMGFNWQPAFIVRSVMASDELLGRRVMKIAACPRCGMPIADEEGNFVSPDSARRILDERRQSCRGCSERLWTLVSGNRAAKSLRDMLVNAMKQIPTIGEKTAQKLLDKFGEKMLAEMLEDNVHEFINLMDESGDLFFSDRQARRMERAMANMDISFGQGGYQPTEFVKRYLPQGYFGLLLVDEGHEYKNEGSAQGQAMGVLARKCAKTVLLTGTLMGGYADDLFHLLFRLSPAMMIEDGFSYNGRNSIGPAAMSFMREHGVLKDVFKESEGASHRTAKAKNITHRTSKGPGFGPKGIMRYVLPYTAFLKLRDIDAGILPPYQEHFTEVPMDPEQAVRYGALRSNLEMELRQALVKGDTSLLGVVLNVLLAWPDCCFRDELVRHPRNGQQLAFVPHIFDEAMPMPKETRLLELCAQERTKVRRVLVYTTYTGTRDTASRLKSFLDQAGFKAAVLRASVDASRREDWLLEQVDRGIDVIVTNPELVKTGLDMLEFPTIVFMQTGYNVYTLQQAARRSWRIGQKRDVDVHYFGYAGSAQLACLELMARKIAVSQSTSGDMPESGLDILNQSGDSIEVALARQLLAK